MNISIHNRKEAYNFIKRLTDGEYAEEKNMRVQFYDRETQYRLYDSGDMGAKDLAAIVGSILEEKRCPQNLELDFSYYHGQRRSLVCGGSYCTFKEFSIEPAVMVIADNLKKGSYAGNLSLNFKINDSWNDKCAIALFEAIEQGSFKNKLSIKIPSAINAMPQIVKALTSSNCPKDMSLDVNNMFLDSKTTKELTSVLKDKNCPETLHLDFCAVGTYAAEELVETLASGQCKPNLSIRLYGSEKDAAILAKAYENGQVPQGLHFDFVGSNDENANILLNALMTAKKNGVLPTGLQISFSASSYNYVKISPSIRNSINEVLSSADKPAVQQEDVVRPRVSM